MASAFLDRQPLTHTLPEAWQVARYFKGELEVPRFLSPYIFGIEQPPEVPLDARRVIEQADVFFVEVSELTQLKYRDWALQQNFFTRYFVKEHGAPLLDWYRALTTGRTITDDLVLSTVDKLETAGVTITDELFDLLQYTRMEIGDANSTRLDMKAIMAESAGRWIFMSHFRVPGSAGAIMEDRGKLATYLADAAAELGAELFDPSVFIDRYGKPAVLDNDGKNIYEYNPDFVPAMGELLAAMISGARPLSRKGEELPALPEIRGADQASPAPTSEQLIEFLNKTLIGYHLERVDALGVNESGLYQHYVGLAQSGSLVQPHLAAVLRVVDCLLPRFDRYIVHKDGLGEVTLMLALRGYTVTGLEPNGPRHAAMQASVSHVAQERPEIASLVTTECGYTLAGDPDPSERTLALCLEMSGTLTDAQKEGIISALGRYSALLVNTRLFLGVNTTAEARKERTDSLRAQGWREVAEWGNNLVYFERD